MDGEVGKGENMVVLDHSGHASWTLITKKYKKLKNKNILCFWNQQ